jgi:hypothetical protein
MSSFCCVPVYREQIRLDPAVLLLVQYRAQFFKRLRSPAIDSKESIPSDYVAWGAGTTNRVIVLARPAT